jgi:hypothetical protein
MFFEPDNGRTQVWSCGGGTQSTAIAVLILQGKLPKPDLAVMIDTERECSEVWEYLNRYTKPALEAFGLPLHVIAKTDFCGVDLWGGKDGNTVMLPGFTDQSGEVGKLQNFCTGEWKRDALGRWLRAQGVEQCDSWIGFSMDELSRIKTDRRKWRRSVYPLIHLRMQRAASIRVVLDYGWPEPPRSRCKMCPNQSDEEWLDMKTNAPDDFAYACQLEREVRLIDKHFWLHESCKPLESIEFKPNVLPLFTDRDCFYGGMCGV